MKEIILLLGLGYILYLFIEKYKLKKRRNQIKYVIHVNGIRGKSTVSRLIDSGMRAGGYKVFTKITGTSPRYIGVDGKEVLIKRRGKANIREQISIFKKATSQLAEVLILECMAVKPDFQKICEKQIVNSNIGIITNVREDHLDEMGSTLDQIAESLSSTIPENGIFFTSDKNYIDYFKHIATSKRTKTLDLLEEKEEYESIDFSENVALALNVCKYLNIDSKIALEGMRNYKRDPGVLKTTNYTNFRGAHVSFVNALAANDPNSSELILNKIKKRDNYWDRKRYLMINNRRDRVSRFEQYIDFIIKLENNFEKILISGENKEIFKTKILSAGVLKNKVVQIKNFEFFENIEEDSMIFAVGNICGKGKKIVDYIEGQGEING